MIHQQKVNFCGDKETYCSWPLWRITTNIWVTVTRVTEWQTATLLVAVCGNEVNVLSSPRPHNSEKPHSPEVLWY